MMQKDECPFCNPEVVSSAFAEESGFYAIYNHAPVVPGHSMIIPFRHVSDMFDLSDNEYTVLFLFARKVTSFLTKYFDTGEFDISLQQGSNAGQSVDHLHLHIIPRRANDLPFGEEWFHKLDEEKHNLLDSGKFLNNEELKQLSNSLRNSWIEQNPEIR
jgi:bis(5'-adenosyl)-triphosphatase